MKTFLARAALVAGLLSVISNGAQAQAGSGRRPAMIASGADSVAAQVHYPAKGKAAKAQAAISFYCEVGADGKAAHIATVGAKDKGEFSKAVEDALRSGRFQPAMAGGKAVPVMLGGTVFFMFHGDEPVVAISLSTADKQKTAALGNYIQPQMLSSDAEFRRKMFKARFDIHFLAAANPGGEVLAQVDAQGNLTGTKLIADSPSGGGYGAVLMKGFEGAKFIPALSNGTPVAGQFNLPLNFKYMRNPDAGPPIGSNIKDDR